ncbi:HAD hydrolase-like protein [Epidermidibacterium keratini]|uniref:HAD hydrolase-like protein n=2 Tax=Epidermidibacterium keratini TaxID=1891644 RepID=A0A7L4YUZ0_9ACTN|nr:HAD hydrolase-like protein [Epidermidibacterium keratini]
MTLIDTRPGMRAVVGQLNAERGYGIDAAAVAEVLGPPLDQLLAPWVPQAEMPEVTDRFREIYAEVAIEPVEALPGAAEALESVHDHGGRILVLTGKFEPNAKRHLKHLDLPYDVLVGSRWATAKADVLSEYAATAYVGDHPADMRAARDAGAWAVGVSTGGYDAAALTEAGADDVLRSLKEFAASLARRVS